MPKKMDRSLHLIVITLLLAFTVMAFQSEKTTMQPKTMPLVPMMRVLLSDMYTIDEGIYTEDFAVIEKGGKSIAEHPVMTEEDKKLVKNTLGEEMQRFISFDMVVHHHADSIAQAAQQKKMNDILHHYKIVQQGCVDCHTAFRKEISKARK